MERTFKVGDFVYGKNDYYGMTDSYMIIGEVLSLHDNGIRMRVKILLHRNEWCGGIYQVLNSSEDFGLINFK